MSTDPELQTGTVDRANPFTAPTPATAANSTTLKQLEAAKARAKLVIVAMTTLASVLLTMSSVLPVSPVVAMVFVIVAVVLFLGAVAVAYFTNSMSTEEIDALLVQVATAGRKLQPAPAPPSDAASRRGPPEP